MGKLIFEITMTLDGYVAGPDPSPDQPLGAGGDRIHAWAYDLAAWREPHGRSGGERNVSDEVVRESVAATGATIMGRRMFGGDGPWGDDPWEGWWGDDPPFHHPVFVLTHHAREPLAKEGGTTFHFITDGIGSALEQARAAAGDKDVKVAGGADAGQQYLAAGLLDELLIHHVPLLLGGGTRLLHSLGATPPELAVERVVAGDAVTHTTYRVVG